MGGIARRVLLPILTFQEIATLWAAGAATIGTLLALAGWGVAKRAYLVLVPQICAERSLSTMPNWLWLKLSGPSADAWEILEISLAKPRSEQFIQRLEFAGQYGEFITRAGPPLGRWQKWVGNPIILSSGAEGTQIKVLMRLKVAPLVRRRAKVTLQSATLPHKIPSGT
jgi:hypothetical protein